MKSAGTVICGMLVLQLVTACSPPRVEVHAIANEGFFVRSQRHAVLVDSLFEATAPYPKFFQQGPSPALVAKMIAGEGIFAEVDLVLVTHHHADHFRAETALAFLQQHPESFLVGTPSVVEQLAALEGFRAIDGRVDAPVQTPGSCVQLDHRSIDVTVCSSRHSGGSDIANNMYLVDMGGIRWLHEGDADRSPETFSALPLGDEPLDLAFLHDWFVLNAGRDVVTDILRPQAVVLMHHRWTAAAETRDRVVQLPSEIASALPPVKVFGAETESAVFPAPP